MRTEFTDDPLARFALASSACDAPAALPSALATGAVRCHSPLAGRLRTCGRLASSGGRRRGEQHSGCSQTGRFRNVAHRHGARWQILRTLGRPEGPQSWNSFHGTVGRRGSTVRDPTASGGRVKGSTWNRADGPSLEAFGQWARALGYAGPGISGQDPPRVRRGTRRTYRIGGARTHGSH